MRRKDNPRGRLQPLGWALAVCFLVLIAYSFIRVRALVGEYNYEAAVTPTPSATVRSVAVTRDPALPTPAPTEQLLRNGSKGEEVTRLQTRLQELGFYAGELDGQFGPGTRAAVELFQQQHNLDADGIVGDDTREVLYSDAAKRIVVTPTPQAQSVLAGALPLLVNHSHTLDESFVPAGLVNLNDVCPADLVTIKGSDIRGNAAAVDALCEMLRAAHADGLTVWQVSAGYRSIAYQQTLFDNQVYEYMNERGMSRADAQSATRLTVAEPGQSEHHTGLAFDLTVPGQFFADTAQSQWLNEHCWEYGFIIRYQEEKQDITGYLAEAWHVRYVGLPHSTLMRDNNWCLEEYLEHMGAADAT